MTRLALTVAVPTLLTAACGGSEPRFTAPLELGGTTVPAAVLNEGHALYGRYCATCHGGDGRGDTPAGRRLDPHPRDFTRADFKYAAGGPGAIPTDADLFRTLREGVPGTGMPAWPGLSDREMHAIIQYLKTFSPRWRSLDRERKPGAQTVLPARGTAASVRAGQTRRGDATTPPQARLAQRAAGDPPAAARGER